MNLTPVYNCIHNFRLIPKAKNTILAKIVYCAALNTSRVKLPALFVSETRDWHVSPARCHPKHDHCYQKPDQTWLPIRMNNFWYKDCFAFSSHLDSMSHKRAHFLAVFFCSRSSLDCMGNMLGPDSCHIISWVRCDCEVDKRSAQLSFSAGPCKWKEITLGQTNDTRGWQTAVVIIYC